MDIVIRFSDFQVVSPPDRKLTREEITYALTSKIGDMLEGRSLGSENWLSRYTLQVELFGPEPHTDTELTAMGRIVYALKELDPAARLRVLEWAEKRYVERKQ